MSHRCFRAALRTSPVQICPKSLLLFRRFRGREFLEPILQKAFMEYSFGNVPDKLETNPLEERKTLILRYGHEFKRLQEREGSALWTQDDSKG